MLNATYGTVGYDYDLGWYSTPEEYLAKKYRPNLRSRPMEVQLDSDWFRPMLEAMTES
jgi:hypothetical protein